MGFGHWDDYFYGSSTALEDVFGEIDEHLAGGGSLRDHEVERAVYNGFFSASVPEPSTIEGEGIQLVFGPSAVTEHDPLSIASRAALYSSRTYIVTPYALRREVFPDPYDSYGTPENYTLEVSPHFVDLAVELKPYLLDGCLSIAPMRSTYVSAEAESYSWAEHSRLLSILLDEDLPGALTSHGASALEVPLPVLSASGRRSRRGSAGAPRSSKVLEVRAEYQEEFLDFQRALARMLGTSPERGEQALGDAIDAVREEVHRIDDRMVAIRRKTWFDTMKLAVTVLPIVLGLVLPPPLSVAVEVATGVVGGGTSGVEYYKDFRQRRAALQDLRRDAFYVPWLLRESL